jgi:DNA processing protein
MPECNAPTGAREQDRLARLALNQAVEPADAAIGRLLERHTPAAVLAAIHDDRLTELETEPARRARLADRAAGLRLRLEPGRVEEAVSAADAVGARFLAPGDPHWPAALDDLGAQRPIGIWALGCWPPAGVDMISVVGARACTSYGSYVAGAVSADLASAGVAVVSGAALGIDAAAHRGALAVGGPTVAVLACGIDRVYPRAHEVLLRAIAERGAVLSELPPGATPTRFRFLHRNRVIAALGSGTVVVEAARRSGSLVTARLAAELGRVVMAVPGPVTSDQSAGTHELIRDGAMLVAEASQVREACSSLTAAAAPQQESEGASSSSSPQGVPGPEVADPIEQVVIEALPTARAAVGADVLALARATGVAPEAVFAALGRLAATGRVVRAGSGWTLAGPANAAPRK